MAAIDRVRTFWRASAVWAMLSGTPAARVRSEDYWTFQGYNHEIAGNIQIQTGVFALNKDLSLNTSIYGRYTYDKIQSGGGEEPEDESAAAAADVTSGASSNDARHEAMFSVRHLFPRGVSVEAGYDHSSEKDYLSQTPSLTLRKELFGKQTTLTLAASKNIDEVSGRYFASTENRDTDNTYFGVTQVLNPLTILQAGLSMSELRGELADGIRLVPIDGRTEACAEESGDCVDEVFPGARSKRAALVGVNRYFTGAAVPFLRRSALHLLYRRYNDDWSLSSHTGEITYYKHIGEGWLLRAGFRRYAQTGADFFKTAYTSADELRTASPALAPFHSYMFGLKLSYEFPESSKNGFRALLNGLTLEAKYDLYMPSHTGNAGVAMLGLRRRF